jgi:hypothetical protein
MLEEQSNPEDNSPKTQRSLRIWVRRMLYLFLLLCFLPVLLWMLIQLPLVQRWAINQIKDLVYNEYGSRVEIESFNWSFSELISLEKVAFYHPSGDTLIAAGELKISLGANIFGLFKKRIDIQSVYLADAYVAYEIFEDGDSFSFLSAKNKKEKSNSGIGITVDVGQLTLERVRFKMTNQVSKKNIDASLRLGEFQLKKTDLENLDFHITKAAIVKPAFYFSMEERIDVPTNLGDAIASVISDLPYDKKLLNLKVDRFFMTDGRFTYHNNRKAPKVNTGFGAFDFNHMNVGKIFLEAEDFVLKGSSWSAVLCNMQLQTDDGFTMNRFQASEVIMDSAQIQVNRMILETPGSVFSDSIHFYFSSLKDFEDFEDLVFMDAKIKRGKLSMQDLFYFAPQLRGNTFFKKYNQDSIVLQGFINGRVNNLRGSDLIVNFANQAQYVGQFSARSLTNPAETLLSLDIQSLRTDVISLKQLIPGLALPENFNKLGRIQFRGRFDGFYEDFVTFGRLSTALGMADVDMKLNTVDGMRKATYSGSMRLYEFDLGKWTGNAEFGRLTARLSVSNGKGMTAETVRANLNANIYDLSFRNYSYNNVQFTGVINKDLLDGQVVANDENMQLDFLGTIDFSGPSPVFKFNSKIDLLDLGELNLVNAPFSFSGDLTIDATIKDISNIDGTFNIKNLILAKSDLHFLHMGDLRLESRYLDRPRKFLNIRSDLLNLDINGDFDFQNIWSDILTVVGTKNRRFAEKWKLPLRDSLFSNNDFDFNLQVVNTKNLSDILQIPLDTIRDLRFRGHFENTLDGSFEYKIQHLLVPKFVYGNIALEGMILQAEGSNADSRMILHMDSASIYGVGLGVVDALINLAQDTLSFNMGIERVLNSFEQLGIVGRYFLIEDRNHVEFNNMEFNALDRRWQIQRQNFIQLSDDFLYARNMLFSDGEAYVNFSTFDAMGLHCQISNVDLAIFNPILDSRGLELRGRTRADLYVTDVRDFKDMDGNVVISDLEINDIPVGDLKILAEQKNFESPVFVNAIATDKGKNAQLNGYFYYPSAPVPDGQYFYEFNTSFDRYSIALSDVFLKGIFSETSGFVNGNLSLGGREKLQLVDGLIELVDVKTKLDYLGTQYLMPSAPVRITEQLIDFGEMELRDQLGNQALLRGGIKHRFFEDFDITMRVTSPQFQVLNTTKKDNNLFYGRAFGKIDLRMSGPFNNLDLNINAETGPNTLVAIPLNSAINDKEQNFIRFTNPEANVSDTTDRIANIQGLSLQMFLTINPQAELQLIFDERTGEIIKGRGNGNIQIELPREGEFQMFGDFEIERGEYPFKAFVVLDKAFSIRRGGTISWYGDPLNAFINLQADYKGLRTSPYNFVYDYIRNDNNLLNEAKRPTDVDLTLNLSGQLLEPRIQFDLAFPTLQGELKNYTDNRLRTLSANPDELNMTAVSLLAFKGFLPQTSDLLSTAAISNTVSSTLTEWVTNQMRVFVNEYLIDSLEKNGLVSNLNLDFGIILNPAIEVDGQPSVAGLAQSQFYLRPQFMFYEDRIILDMGLTTFGDVTAGGRVGGEFNVEYAFGNTRRLRARAYAQNQPLINDNRIVSGVGLTYRREYNTFAEMLGFGKKQKSKSSDNSDKNEKETPAAILPEREGEG